MTEKHKRSIDMIRKLRHSKCNKVWEVSPGGYWTYCPRCGEGVEIEKVMISARD